MRGDRDERENDWVEDKPLLARARRRLKRLRELQVELAQDLSEVEQKKAYRPSGASSLGDWVQRNGGDGTDAWRLLRIGAAIEANRALEKKARSGRLPLANVAQLGRTILQKRQAEARMKRAAEKAGKKGEEKKAAGDDHVTPDAQLVLQAETQTPAEFRQTMDAEVESRGSGAERRERVSVNTSKQGVRLWGRAQQLASRSAGRSLTPGQAFDFINADFVKRKNPARKAVGSRKRKIGKTSGNPKKRTVPAEVRRSVFDRAGGDCCEMPGCPNQVHLHWAHGDEPNAEGGGQEVWNTLRLCSSHHGMFDKFVLGLAGWTHDGRPAFSNLDGDVFLPGDRGKPRACAPKGMLLQLHPAHPGSPDPKGRGRAPPAR